MKYIFIITISVLNFFYLNAQQGTLDSSFGINGTSKTYTGGSGSIAIGKSNEIYIGGRATLINDTGFCIRKYMQEGNIDLSFGKNGFAVIHETKPIQLAATAISLYNNKIIAAGIAAGGINGDIFLARFKENGIVDSTFGINGTVTTDFGSDEWIHTMQVQTDGKIIIGGEIDQHNFTRKALIVKYTTDGSLDKSFGDEGKIILNGNLLAANSLAIQKDGKIVIGGIATIPDNNFFVARLNADGSYDKNFGTEGIVITDFAPNEEYINSVAIQLDGKIIAAGVSGIDITADKQLMSVARYDVEGNLDQSFGIGGKSTVKFKNASEAVTTLLQKDGKIILVGRTFKDDKNYSDIAIARLSNNGDIDSSFGINGSIVTDFGGSDASNAAALDNNQKILISDATYVDALNYYYILARYNNDDKTQKQIIITKIKRWLQHHNGFTWDNNSSVSSYVVQHSFDGIHFTSIAKINAGSSSNTYADPSPLNGNNYYRLQTTSVSGAVNYSNVIAVTANDNNVTISPNPAKNNLQVQGLSSSTKTKLTVVDFSGNIKLSATVNNTSYNLNITSLKPGNYLLKIETNGVVITRKFVKE